MGVFEQFPYTNFHDLNLDWILKEIKRCIETVDAAGERFDGIDTRLDGLDADVARVEGEIPDVVQTMGFRTDAVMSQKAVTDAINRSEGVTSIEYYHKAGQDLNPDVFHTGQTIKLDGDYDLTQTDGACIICRNPPAGKYLISMAGPGDTGSASEVLAAATYSTTSPTSGEDLEYWSVSAAEGATSFEIDIPEGVGCLIVNSYDEATATPRAIKLLAGVWVWDGLPANSVDTVNIVDGAVTTDKIHLGAVTTNKIALEAVETSRLAPSARPAGITIYATEPTAIARWPYTFALLDSDPATKYAGWVYLIKETTP